MLSLLAAYMKGLFLFLFLHFGVSHLSFRIRYITGFIRFILPPQAQPQARLALGSKPNPRSLPPRRREFGLGLGLGLWLGSDTDSA